MIVVMGGRGGWLGQLNTAHAPFTLRLSVVT